jgi:hypothetical protein
MGAFQVQSRYTDNIYMKNIGLKFMAMYFVFLIKETV